MDRMDFSEVFLNAFNIMLISTENILQNLHVQAFLYFIINFLTHAQSTESEKGKEPGTRLCGRF